MLPLATCKRVMLRGSTYFADPPTLRMQACRSNSTRNFMSPEPPQTWHLGHRRTDRHRRHRFRQITNLSLFWCDRSAAYLKKNSNATAPYFITINRACSKKVKKRRYDDAAQRCRGRRLPYCFPTKKGSRALRGYRNARN